MTSPQTYLVFGATGGTGRHFTRLALSLGHTVRAVARVPAKLQPPATDGGQAKLTVVQGDIADPDRLPLNTLLPGVDAVIVMVGDKSTQSKRMICDPFVRTLVPAMRAHGVKRKLYQAGGFSCPPGQTLPWSLWLLRNTIARGFDGQHRDNEAVMRYLDTEAGDMEWIVHRAGIYGDTTSKGTLHRSTNGKFSVGNFVDCADYSLRVIREEGALRTCDFSVYA